MDTHMYTRVCVYREVLKGPPLRVDFKNVVRESSQLFKKTPDSC